MAKGRSRGGGGLPYIYTYIVYTYIYIYVYVYICIYVYMYICIYVYMYIIRTCTYMCFWMLYESLVFNGIYIMRIFKFKLILVYIHTRNKSVVLKFIKSLSITLPDDWAIQKKTWVAFFMRIMGMSVFIENHSKTT